MSSKSDAVHNIHSKDGKGARQGTGGKVTVLLLNIFGRRGLTRNQEEDLKNTMKRLGKYLDRKGLMLNVNKSKIMTFVRGRMKTKNQE